MAALTGWLILGPRAGKYGSDGKITPIAGANMPLACLGTFIPVSYTHLTLPTNREV